MTPQPTLPAEGTYTELEQLFISEQPRLLWPTNQNSNFGVLRKVLTDVGQDAVDTISDLLLELFVPTSIGYLTRWEGEMGLPKDPTGKSLDQRRDSILERTAKGRFTRARRQAIVEKYITATYGDPTDFTPAGIPITAGGITMFAGTAPPSSLYTITETITSFYYQVSIDASVTPDLISMRRELRRITPAGVTFDITIGGTTTTSQRQAQITWAEMETPS